MTEATVAPQALSNSPVYDEAMRLSGLVGSNFKTLRDNKRKLAHSLVCSSVVEGFALSEAIKAAKGRMKWLKLDKPEQNQMNVLFNAVRTIDGAWKALPEDVQTAFIAGEIVFSTLAKQIKDAEKQELEAEDAQDAPEAPAPEAEAPAPEAPAPEVEDFMGKPTSQGVIDAVEYLRAAMGEMEALDDTACAALATLFLEMTIASEPVEARKAA